jgi:glycosyltransferase involved in cell wall biosynthesis
MTTARMSHGPVISAVICTHNRAGLLRLALESLVCQTLDPDRYEIIVVDNRSTDNTKEVVAAYQTANVTRRIRLIHESQLGLGYARNAGWQQGCGDYVAFMDDDAKADTGWLELAVRYFEQAIPTPVAVGGPILPYYPTPKSSWFKDEYECRSWGDNERLLRLGESFSGSNMIFRRDLLQRFGGFDVRVGMRGTHLSVGEERALFEKMVESSRGLDSLPLYYSPRLIVYHAVGANKMCASYHLRRAFATGRDLYVLNGPKEFRALMRHLRLTAIAIKDHAVGAVRQYRDFPDYRNWIVESASYVALELGRLLQGLKTCLSILQGKS